ADNVRYHAPTHLTYVAHAEKQLGVLDAQSYEKKAEINLPGSAESFQLEKTRPRLYVNVPDKHEVAVIDTTKNEVVATHAVKKAQQNVALALDEANHRLFVGCRKEPTLVILDSESGAEVGSVPIGGDTDDVFYDAKGKRIYASCGEGAIVVIRQADADHYEALDKIETVKGARTSLLDAESGRYYLAVPRQPGKDRPEGRGYHVKPGRTGWVRPAGRDLGRRDPPPGASISRRRQGPCWAKPGRPPAPRPGAPGPIAAARGRAATPGRSPPPPGAGTGSRGASTCSRPG